MDTTITQQRTENPMRQWLYPTSERHSLVKS